MDIDIFQLPGILKRRLHYVVLTTLVCLALVSAYLMTQAPLFRASTELLLDPQGLVADRRDLFSSGGSPQEQSSLDSQIYIVQSREVLNEVVRALDLDKDSYFRNAIASGGQGSSEAALASVVSALAKRIKVERAGQSFVLTITAEHPVAARAAEIANTLASIYLDKANEARVDAAVRASKAFQLQASELQDRVLKAEMAVETFKAENGLVSAGQQGLVIDQQVAGMTEQLTQARALEEQQRTNYELSRNLTIEAIEAGAIPEVAQSQSIEVLRSRYAQLRERESELATSLGTNHPQMRAVRSQMANLQGAIEAEINRIREAMRSNYERAAANTKALAASLEELKKTSLDSSVAQTRMRQLESEAEAVRAIYKTFLNRAEELGQTQAVNTNNSHVISYAVPPSKASGGLKLVILVAAGLFGVALGSGLAVIRELIAGLTLSERELVARTGIPVIGHIPAEQGETESRLSGLVRRLLRREKPLDEISRTREIAILRIVHLLLDTFGRNLPATILFVSPAQDPPEGDVVADVVQILADLDQDVLFAGGKIRPPSRFRQNRSGSLLVHAGDAEDQGLPLADRLHYDRVKGGYLSGSTAYASGTDQYRRAQFVIVNACGTEAAEYLPALVKKADGIIAITPLATVSRSGLDDLSLALEAHHDAVLGQIVIGKAA